MKKGSFWKNYGFLILMLTGIVAGCVVGAIWPAVKDADGEIIVKGATVLEPLGTVFHEPDVLHRGADGVLLHFFFHRQHAEREARGQDHGRDHRDLPDHRGHRRRHHVCDRACSSRRSRANMQ